MGYPAGYHGDLPKLAECTDHILPIKTHPERKDDPSNHQSLCLDCNRRKSIALEGGLGR